MARDYTKYTVEGLAENLNKRQLVLAIVKEIYCVDSSVVDIFSQKYISDAVWLPCQGT